MHARTHARAHTHTHTHKHTHTHTRTHTRTGGQARPSTTSALLSGSVSSRSSLHGAQSGSTWGSLTSSSTRTAKCRTVGSGAGRACHQRLHRCVGDEHLHSALCEESTSMAEHPISIMCMEAHPVAPVPVRHVHCPCSPSHEPRLPLTPVCPTFAARPTTTDRTTTAARPTVTTRPTSGCGCNKLLLLFDTCFVRARFLMNHDCHRHLYSPPPPPIPRQAAVVTSAADVWYKGTLVAADANSTWAGGAGVGRK
jgi:hypothetical protein